MGHRGAAAGVGAGVGAGCGAWGWAGLVLAWGGALAGRRVVRGREAECRAWYANH